MVIVYKSLYLEAKYWGFFLLLAKKRSKAEVIVILVVVQRS